MDAKVERVFAVTILDIFFLKESLNYRCIISLLDHKKLYKTKKKIKKTKLRFMF